MKNHIKSRGGEIMIKTSIREKIINYLKSKRRWVSGGELEDLSSELKCKGSTISRRAREIYCSVPNVFRKYNKGFVCYRYNR